MMLDDIELPNNFIWPDEFQFNQVEQSRERSLMGGLIIQEGIKLYGRPITLSEGWVSRSTLDALYTKEAQAGLSMTLTMPDAREFTVVFDRARGFAIEARPVFAYTKASKEPEWQYAATLRFSTVEPSTPATPE